MRDLRKNVLRRDYSDNDVIKAYNLLNEAGIRNSSFLMFGLPFESRETYEKTVELCRKANVQYPISAFFYPYEGTEIRDLSIREGFFDPQDSSNIVNNNYKPSLQYTYLSEEELIEMRQAFILYVKLPQCYKKFIRRSEKPDKHGVMLQEKLVEIFDKTVFINNGWFADDGLQEKYLLELREIEQKYQEEPSQP